MALVKYEDTVFQSNSGRAYPGVKVEALSGGVPVQLYRDASGAEPANQITTNANGLFTFWVAEGVYTIRYSLGGVSLASRDGVGIYNLVKAVELADDEGAETVGVATGDTLQQFLDTLDQTSTQKANANAIGVDGSDNNMGTAPGTGSILTPNGSVKEWFGELHTNLSDINSDGANIIPMDPSLGASYKVGTVGKALLNNRRYAVNLEDYYVSTDGGSMHLAFERATATGAKRINVGLDAYNLSSPAIINRSNIAIVGPAEACGGINLTGSTEIAFDIGNAASQTFHVYLRDLLVTRSITAAGSKVARIRNVSYFGLTNSRFYMDNKFGSALDIQSGSYHVYRDLRFSDSIDHSVQIAGGSAGGGGAVGGWCVGFRWRDCIFDGANAGKASPTEQASFIMGDYVQALWMRDCEGFRHLGPLVDMRGTLPARSVNALNLFFNLNVEATNSYSAAIRMDNYVSNEVSDGWCSGKAMPAIIMGAGSQVNRVQNVQVGITSSDCIEDSGTGNRFEGNELVGYSSAFAGVRWKDGSSKGVLKGGEVTQTASVAINEAGSAGHHVDDVTSSTISGPHFMGFDGGSNSVEDYRSADSDPYTSRSSTTLDVPHGLNGRPCRVLGTAGNIDNLRAGDYYLEPLTLWLDTGMVIRDKDISGGNIRLESATTITGDDRNKLTLAWDSSSSQWRVA